MPHRILIVNPNSNKQMTDSLSAPIESLNYNDTTYTFFTGPPSSPYSINTLSDGTLSTTACLPLLTNTTSLPDQNPYNIRHHDAALIACYSPHPLVPALQSHLQAQNEEKEPVHNIPVIGIFEASISVALQLLSSSPTCPSPTPTSSSQPNPRPGQTRKFGIISTGPQWRSILSSAITAAPPPGTSSSGSSGAALGAQFADRVFAGVETVGVDAGDLHPSSPSTTSAPPLPPPATSPPATSAPIPSDPCPATIKQKVQAATARVLARGDVGVIILGCAGMAGMEEWVREEVDSGGQTGVRVVDGVKAGVGVLQGLLRGGY